ncbi:MAG TPA: ATP-binding cassette domain-containing protein [Stellaceae bacterium]|nr:ATP-binding cassette domain-containing protein [Stellaceae bacterium]
MLEIRNLSKNFGALVAVDDVSFTVSRGEVLGFLGPNGAGKSTTMKMITGFLAPSAGTAVICGADIQARPLAAKRQFGYLPEGAPAYPDMTVAEFLRFVAHIRGLRGDAARARIDAIVARVHLNEVYEQRIETLSKGFRRRVGVAQALIHDPPVIILDEPTDGLDPNQKYEMRGILAAMQAEKAIILSTHLLEEVEAVCSRAIIIARGRILADATPAELTARSRFRNAVRLDIEPEHEARIRGDLAALADIAAIETLDEGRTLLIVPRDGRSIAAAIADLSENRDWQIGGFTVERGRLDDVFRTITAPAAIGG